MSIGTFAERARSYLLGAALGLASAAGAVAQAQTTPPKAAPMQPSNEATSFQLKLAREQGDAVRKAQAWVLGHAAAGGHRRAGEYTIAYAVSPPEGWYAPDHGKLVWHPPQEGVNAHLRIIVRDGGDGRFVPGLTVRAALVYSDGQTVSTTTLPFGWYPLLNGYGANIRLPRSGTYRLRVTIPPPHFWRHDPHNGYRFAQTVHAEFAGLRVNTQALAQAQPLTVAETKELAQARQQGRAVMKTLHEMWRQGTSGDLKRIGTYHLAVAVEYDEAYWYYPPGSNTLTYKQDEEASTERNSHIEVAPLDSRTNRFIPVQHVTVTVYDRQGRPIGTHREHFMWHPWLWHFGKNWRVPDTGAYRLRVRFDAPTFRRYGRKAGRRFARPVDVMFGPLRIATGTK